MKRRKKKQRRVPAGASGSGPQSADRSRHASRVKRRAALLKIRNGLMALAVVGGFGWYLVEEVRASNREHDLSRLGNGIATVVQIHDPQCPTCRALQRETRDAIKSFGPDEIQYLVANVRMNEGWAFARAHGVDHVTLLLFDGKGNHRDTLVGPNTAEALARVFRRHVKKSAGG